MRASRTRRLAAAFALLLAGCSDAARTASNAAAAQTADAMDTAALPLSDDVAQRWTRAYARLADWAADPVNGEGVELDLDAVHADELARRIEAVPAARSILRAERLDARDYVLTTLAVFRARFENGAAAGGAVRGVPAIDGASHAAAAGSGAAMRDVSAVPASSRPIEVQLNGAHLGDGLLVRAAGGAAGTPYLSLADLQRAVDGASRPRRLQLVGIALYGGEPGQCDGCSVRVSRPVRITGGVRLIGEGLYVPLRDVVRAFEGRLQHDVGEHVFSIHAGECRWCILEPGEGAGRAEH